MIASLKKNQKAANFMRSLRFAFYCLTHPIDGFWDLTHERRGSLAAANTILVATLLARLMRLQFTGFLFLRVYWPEVNIILQIGSVLFVLALWCVGNWALTTLFDGKGRLSQIYMATCYGMLPYPLIQFPLIILSNVVTADEAEFYVVLSNLSLVWAAVLIVFAMAQIHEYKMAKNIGFIFATVVAMLVMVFILLLFFSMISQGVGYFISIVKELLYRI